MAQLDINQIDGLKTKITTAFLCAVFLIVPLCLHNSFYDARYVKYYAFYALTALYLCSMLCATVAGAIKFKQLPKLKPSWQDIIFIAFALIGILSTVISGHAKAGLFAHNNREQGIITFIIYCVLFLLIKRHGRITPTLKLFMLLAFSIACTLGILNQFRLDPFGFVRILPNNSLQRFASTVGNINFYGAYCVLLLPVPYFIFLHSQERKKTLLYGCLSILAHFGTVSARTEGALLGLLAMIAFVPLLCSTPNALKRHIFSIGGMLLILGMYRLCAVLLKAFALSNLLNAMLQPLPLAVMLTLWAVLTIFARDISTHNFKRVKRVYAIVLFSLIAAVIIALVVINVFFAQSLPATIAKYAVITPSWGTDRGMIWQRAIEIEHSFTPLQKLIGAGSGCFARWDCFDRLFSNGIMDTAHNEYLHYMLTHGFLGLALYLAFIASSLRRGIRDKGVESRALAAGCICYCTHALVSFAQMFTTPLFFIMMFLLNVDSKTDEQVMALPPSRFSLITACSIAALCLIIGWLRTNY